MYVREITIPTSKSQVLIHLGKRRMHDFLNICHGQQGNKHILK